MPQDQNCHRDKYFRKHKQVAEIILAKEMGTECVLGNEEDSFLN